MPIPIPRKHPLPWIGALLLISAFITCTWAFAFEQGDTSPLIVGHHLERLSITPHISYLIDPTGDAEIHDIVRHSERFKAVPDRRGDPSFGYSRAAYWFMLRVNNRSSVPVDWVLEFSYPLTDFIALYVPDNDTYRVLKTGDRLPFDQREIYYRNFAFPLTEPPGERAYFLRVESSGALTVPLMAWSPPAFQRKMNVETMVIGFSYGILLALAIYHLFIFFSIRENSYLFLAFIIVFPGLFSMTNIGITYQFLWPDNPAWGNKAHPFFLAMGNLATLQFARVFLNTKTVFPRLDLFLRIAMALAALLIPLSLVVEYYHMTRATALLTLVTGILVITAGVAAFAKGYREARFYLLACIAFFVGAMLSVVRAYGFLPENFITLWSSQIGLATMALLFSFGVADKINVIRREREKAVEALADSEEKYRNLVENAHDGIVMLLDERPVFANNALMEMLGYPPKEFMSLAMADLLPETPTGKDLVIARYRKRIRGEDVPSRYEGQMMKKDGTVIDCVFSASGINIGGRWGVIAIISDITSLKRAERTITEQYDEIQNQYSALAALNQELSAAQETQVNLNQQIAEEKEQLATILKSISDAVIATDIQGRVILMNNAAERLTGKKQEEAIDLDVRELLKIPPGSLPEGIGDAALNGDYPVTPFITDAPLKLTRKDGSQYDVEIAGAPLRAPGGGRAGMVLAVRDITAKMKLEKEIQKAGKIESIGILAGGIAHDFNNLLTAIIGNLSLLRELIPNEHHQAAPVLDRVEKAAVQTVNLTRQLLTFSRGGEPVRTRASVHDLLHNNIDFLLSGSTVTSRFDIQEDIWPVEVDTDQIVQVIHNLVINAVQAMPGGGELVVSAANHDRVRWLPLPQGRYVRISFKDHGVGIPRHQLSRIFDPYFSTKQQGNGLGLSICYSIVKKHGGHIDVESVENSGSSFHIYLPATEGDIPRKSAVSHASKVRRGRVLVMDDEEAVREVADGILSHLGFEVVCVKEGDAAVEHYHRAQTGGTPFSAVILDLTVTGGTGGREAIRKLLEIDPQVVALVSSGYSEDMVLANYREFGFSGVLLKPYTMEELAQALDGALNSGGTPQDPQQDPQQDPHHSKQ